jgi:DNA-binding ferritin-like protein
MANFMKINSTTIHREVYGTHLLELHEDADEFAECFQSQYDTAMSVVS